MIDGGRGAAHPAQVTTMKCPTWFYILRLLLIVPKETIFLFILTLITFPRPQFRFVRYGYYKGALKDKQFVVNS